MITMEGSSMAGQTTPAPPSEGPAFIYRAATPTFVCRSAGRLACTAQPDVQYCRWDYNLTPPDLLLNKTALVRVEKGIELTAFPADWGPHPDTGRVADLSPGLMLDLGIETDDEVEIIFPA